MEQIKDKHLRILSRIHEFIEENGYPPTVRDICNETGIASTSTVHAYLARLEKNGYINKDATKTRAMELTQKAYDYLGINTMSQVPLLGRVAAGNPILAVEDAREYYPVPPELNYQADELFMLEIDGESMINIGIMNGDYIYVRKQSTANNGDVVVAMTDEYEATCKTFYKKSDHIILRPENDDMDDIIVPNCTILGKVVSLYRVF